MEIIQPILELNHDFVPYVWMKHFLTEQECLRVLALSYIAHRILPVNSGCRKSVVGWIAGPPYR